MAASEIRIDTQAGWFHGPDDDADGPHPMDILRTSSLHRYAISYVISEVLGRGTAWSHTNEPVGCAIADSMPAMIESALACGYCIVRTTPKGELQVGHPDQFDVWRNKIGETRWRAKPHHAGVGKGWQVHVLSHPPLHVLRPKPREWPSAVVHSLIPFKRLCKIEANWLRRDEFNSRPGAFVSVSSNLRPVGNSKYHWFSASGEHPLATNPTADTFNDLVSARAEAVTRLEEATHMEVEAIDAARQGGGLLAVADRAPATKEHGEFVVSDGRDYKESKALPSSIDARQQFGQARHDVLNSLGIPPQALGETVNSERTAANAAQYEIAMNNFYRACNKLRCFMDRVLLAHTELPDGAHCALVPGLPAMHLHALLPFMEPAKAQELLAAAYRVPKDIFSQERIANNGMPTGGGGGGGGGGNGGGHGRKYSAKWGR